MSLVVLIFLFVALQVVSRYVFSSPYTWTEELSRYSLVWLTFIAAGLVMARGRHISVDIIAGALGRRFLFLAEVLTSLIIIGTSAAFVYYAIEPTLAQSGKKSTAAGLPSELLFLPSLIGFSLIALHSAVHLADVVRKRSVETPDYSEPIV